MEIDILKTTEELAKILVQQGQKVVTNLKVLLEFDPDTFEDIDRQLHLFYWESGYAERLRVKKINRNTIHLITLDILFIISRKPERITFKKNHGSFY